MTHNQAIGNLITAVLTDYVAVDARSLDLEEFLDQQAMHTSTPTAYCSGGYRGADPAYITDNGQVLLYTRRATVWLAAQRRDVDADVDTLLSGSGINGEDATKRTYTIGTTDYMVTILEAAPREAEHGFPVIELTIELHQIGE